MPTQIVPLPTDDAISEQPRAEFIRNGRKDGRAGLITQRWVEFFTSLGQAVQTTNSNTVTVTRTDQSASIGATDLSSGLAAGLYTVTYYARVVRAATTSSSLEVTIDWTDRGTAMAITGAAITGNTITSVQTAMLLIRSDTASPMRYSTTYASVGGTTMQYDLVIVFATVGA